MQDTQGDRHEVGVVFWVSAAVALAFILWGVIAPANFGTVTQAIFDWVVSNLGWFYLLAGNFFLVFVIILALSRYGKFRLGKEGERPEFSTFAWFAMLFQAGMGPSLIFWGVAEPLSHYSAPPFGMAQAETAEAAQVGIQYTYFHWALHPWAMYAVVGLTVGYFSFRRDEPGLMSPVFRPLLGDRVDGPLGKTIDVLAVLAVLFGVAVSLGQAGLQLTAGLGETFGTPTGIAVQLIVIGVTTVAFMISASTAINKGINYLSQISMYVAGVLLVFFLVMGPTATQLGALTQGVGDYLGGIIPMSMRLDSFAPNNAWLGSWTVFYWSWWIAWCPYVGLFIARISRGRTIRQFVAGDRDRPERGHLRLGSRLRRIGPPPGPDAGRRDSRDGRRRPGLRDVRLPQSVPARAAHVDPDARRALDLLRGRRRRGGRRARQPLHRRSPGTEALDQAGLGRGDGGHRRHLARGRRPWRAAVGLRPVRGAFRVHHGPDVPGLLHAPAQRGQRQ